MSDRLAARLPVAVQALLTVGVLAGAGAVAGIIWNWVWTPTTGVVVDHTWNAGDAIGLQHAFSATGWYVVVGAAAGLVGGVLVAALFDRVPLLTLGALVVGSALGAWLMLIVGTALGPGDPATIATTAADGTRLPQQLDVTGASPLIALPVGALTGLIVVFLGVSASRARHSSDASVSAVTPD